MFNNSMLWQTQVKNSIENRAERIATQVEIDAAKENADVRQVRQNRAIKTIQREAKVKEAQFNQFVLPPEFCTPEFKIYKLVELLNNALSLPIGTIPIRDIVIIIKELNLMQGHYAATKHVVANISVSNEQREKLTNLIEEYRGQY